MGNADHDDGYDGSMGKEMTGVEEGLETVVVEVVGLEILEFVTWVKLVTRLFRTFRNSHFLSYVELR